MYMVKVDCGVTFVDVYLMTTTSKMYCQLGLSIYLLMAIIRLFLCHIFSPIYRFIYCNPVV